MLRQCTGKKQPANMMTTATSILAAFRRVRNWPIVLELAGGQGFRKSARGWSEMSFVIVCVPGDEGVIGFSTEIQF